MNKKNNFLIAEVIYLAVMLLLVAVRLMGGLGWFDDIAPKALDVGFTFAAQVVIMFAVPYFAYKFYDKKRDRRREKETNEIMIEVKKRDAAFADFGFRKISLRWVLWAFALGLMLYVLNVFVAGLFSIFLDEMGYRFPASDDTWTGWSGLFIMLGLSCVLPAFCEEFTHRGMLLSGFQSKFSNYRAVACVSLLFGLMHMNIQQFVYAAVLGWFICMGALSSRSVWVPVIIHFTNNAVGTYLSYSQDLGLWGLEFIQFLAGSNFFLSVLILILIFSGTGAIMKYMARENFQKNKTVFVAKYMALHSNELGNVDFERVGTALERAMAGMQGWKAVFAYCETNEKPQKLTALERAVFVSLFVLGSLITVFTLQWGLL
jgi:membrane protease YdiL (CAAX protease family)